MILIVDDKQENVFSLQKLLQLNLYQVDTALSGEEALKKILKQDYSLIILDVQMPGMDGYEVAESVSGYSKTRNIPIIFLSAVNIDKSFVTKGYAAGGVDYITKPFDPDMLLLKVRTFYRLSEQTRALNLVQAALKEEIEIRKQAQKALEEVNMNLEDKVQDRTRELLEINQQLELSNIELQQYASLASHDLQEPLRKIITFSRLIVDKEFVLPEGANYLNKIIASSERMRNLINDLLNYSKLSSASAYSIVNLQEILSDNVSDLELSIREKNAQIIIDEDLPDVEVIPGQMRQVFQNILSNALKFSQKDLDPVIRIWSEPIAECSISAPVSQQGDYIRIHVQDNGIGFNEMYTEKLFTMFQRLHGRQEYEGTGIGLAVVKKIIEKHHGLLWAKSTEGQGTTFLIVLPLRQPVSTAQNESQGQTVS